MLREWSAAEKWHTMKQGERKRGGRITKTKIGINRPGALSRFIALLFPISAPSRVSRARECTAVEGSCHVDPLGWMPCLLLCSTWAHMDDLEKEKDPRPIHGKPAGAIPCPSPWREESRKGPLLYHTAIPTIQSRTI